MTRKHYEAIAAAIAQEAIITVGEHSPEAVNLSEATRRRIARRLADNFGIDNPRFDRSRFLEACGAD